MRLAISIVVLVSAGLVGGCWKRTVVTAAMVTGSWVESGLGRSSGGGSGYFLDLREGGVGDVCLPGAVFPPSEKGMGGMVLKGVEWSVGRGAEGGQRLRITVDRVGARILPQPMDLVLSGGRVTGVEVVTDVEAGRRLEFVRGSVGGASGGK